MMAKREWTTKITPIRLECIECGETADAACRCGVAYVPAGARAAKAIADNPEKSDRAIAAELGVSDMTVGPTALRLTSCAHISYRSNPKIFRN
jgi:hypothetical protein